MRAADQGTAAPPLRLTVIGIGYLGLTHAACMADLGHEVMAIDVDRERIKKASAGEMPFFEPGLEALLRKSLESGRLRFTTSYEEVADFGGLHFLCVGTPQAPGGAADLTFITQAADALAPCIRSQCLIAGKSTVPVGTARKLLARIRATAPAGDDVDLAWNPEFLREGHAIQDTLQPERFVFGVASEQAASLLRQVYDRPLANGIPGLVMDLETAELVKVSANAFLATKISFINAMADACEAAGADVMRLTEALAHDKRIGRRSMSPGLGFGGGCLPKDIRAFRATALSLGVDSVARLLGDVDEINQGRRVKVVDMARDAVGGSLPGKRIAVLGIAFKPNSDDIRDSPSLEVCRRLTADGAIVSAHDPVALENAAKSYSGIHYRDSIFEAVKDADLVMHLTEWPEYQTIDPAALGRAVARRALIDARCVLDAATWESAGWSVRIPGRSR
jgi:UDPglucose 6-dehydrogenase